MNHTKETTIVIRMDKEEAIVLNKLLEELKTFNDWNEIEKKVIQDMQDILTTY